MKEGSVIYINIVHLYIFTALSRAIATICGIFMYIRTVYSDFIYIGEFLITRSGKNGIVIKLSTRHSKKKSRSS